MKNILPLLLFILTVFTNIVKPNTTESILMVRNPISGSNSTTSRSSEESASSDSKCKVPRSSEETPPTVTRNPPDVRLEENNTVGNEVGEVITRPKRELRVPPFFRKLGHGIKTAARKIFSPFVGRKNRPSIKKTSHQSRPPPKRVPPLHPDPGKAKPGNEPEIKPPKPYKHTFPKPKPKPNPQPNPKRKEEISRPIFEPKKES